MVAERRCQRTRRLIPLPLTWTHRLIGKSGCHDGDDVGGNNFRLWERDDEFGDTTRRHTISAGGKSVTDPRDGLVGLCDACWCGGSNFRSLCTFDLDKHVLDVHVDMEGERRHGCAALALAYFPGFVVCAGFFVLAGTALKRIYCIKLLTLHITLCSLLLFFQNICKTCPLASPLDYAGFESISPAFPVAKLPLIKHINSPSV